MIDLSEYIKLPKSDRQIHLNLNEACLVRGGSSTQHRGVLAEYLGTNIPDRKITLAHACNNGKCSNPRHLYWATPYENIVEDGRKFGSHKSIWERTVEKYGLEKAKQLNSRPGQAKRAGAGNKGKPKSEAHKRSISEALKRKARIAQQEEASDLKSLECEFESHSGHQ